MKIAALYVEPTLTVQRRVQFPYRVLAERGHAVSFLQVPTLSSGLAYGYDVTVLPGWVPSQEEVEELREVTYRQGRVVAYDLAESTLLEEETVRETLFCCRLVSVPSAYLAREVRLVVPPTTKVVVLPSTLDPQYFAQARRQPAFFPFTGARPLIIGAFGPFDWALVLPALAAFCKQHPRALILSDASHPISPDWGVDLRLSRALLTTQDYPRALLACDFGLVPLEARQGQDPVWVYEYGILCKPVITSVESEAEGGAGLRRVQNTREAWLAAMQDFARNSEVRHAAGEAAFRTANEKRATQVADQYLKALRQLLPHLR